MFKFGVPEKLKALPCEKQNFYWKAGVLGQTLLDILVRLCLVYSCIN